MKKVFAILFVAAMASMAACTSKTEGAADSALSTMDSAASSAVATMDSTASAVADSAKAIVDSVKK